VRFLQIALVISAIGCAHPLRQVLSRTKPLSWAGKIVVFSLVLALWFSALAPLLIILNVKLDSSRPERMERPVLETQERGTNVCKVKVSEWKSGSPEEHWLWLECPHPHQNKIGSTRVFYSVHRGALGFTWVDELELKH